MNARIGDIQYDSTVSEVMSFFGTPGGRCVGSASVAVDLAFVGQFIFGWWATPFTYGQYGVVGGPANVNAVVNCIDYATD